MDKVEIQSPDIELTEDHPLVKRARAVSNPELLAYLASSQAPNIAAELPDDELSAIGQRVVEGKQKDWESYASWRTNMAKILSSVEMEHEVKDYPWPNASNIKFPLIADAAMQFAARAYPEIIQGTKVVKCQVVGPDPDGAKTVLSEKISEHMSWQILEDMPEWEADMDALLHALPVYGTLYKKTYYDPLAKKNVSIMLTPFECVVNNNVKSNSTPKRITHIMRMYPNDVVERVNAGVWVDPELGLADMTSVDPKTGEYAATGDGDDASFYIFLEQHRWEDLDGDGYEEPYIVTVHEASGKVVRIVAGYDEEGIKTAYDEESGKPTVYKVNQVEYFTRYIFFPDPCGAWLGKGFGQLLFSANMSINTILNQLIDSGTLANLQGGFRSSEAKIDGTPSIIPGQFISTNINAQDLRNAFLPLPFKEPSSVLFQLLGLVVSSSKEFASISAAMSGSEMPANANATSVLAVLDQGLKVFNGIYKRLYRSLRSEFKKLARLNSLYLEEVPYFASVPIGSVQQPQHPQTPPPPSASGQMLNEAFGMVQQAGQMVGAPINEGQPQQPPQSQQPPQIPPPQRPLTKADYAQADLDIIPVADPNMSTSVQKMTKIQALQQWASTRNVGVNMYAIDKMFLETLQVPNVDEILIPPSQIPPQPPDPMSIKVHAEAQALLGQVQVEMMKLENQKAEIEAKVRKMMTDGMLNIAKAKKLDSDASLAQSEHELNAVATEFEFQDRVRQAIKEDTNGPDQSGV